jgi:hypothetical protein
VSRIASRCFLIIATQLFLAVTWRALAYERIGFTEDMALSMAVADAALHGTPVLLGPPSHTGGRHLGPIGYWYVMAAEKIGGSTYGAVAVIGGVEAMALLAAAWLASKLASDELRNWAAGSALLCASATHYPALLSYPWHNHFFLVMTMLFLLALWRAWRGGRAGTALTALYASALVQFHYSSLPFVAVLGAALLWNRRGDGLKILALGDLVSLAIWGITILLWVPLIIYQLHFPGALAQTFGPHTVQAVAHSGMKEAFRMETGILKLYALGPELFPSEWPAQLRESLALGLLAACAALLAAGVYAAEAPRRNFLLSLIAATVVYVPALAWLPPPLFPSYFFTFLPVPVIFAGVGFAAGAALFIERRALLLRFFAGAVLGIWLVVWARQSAGALEKSAFHPAWHSLQHGEQVAAIINRDRGGRRVELLGPGAQSFVMRGVLLYFLGRYYYPQIEYWNWLAELPRAAASPGAAEYAYFLSCPHLLKRDLDAFDARAAAQGWRPEREIDMNQCTTCAHCVLIRYRREGAVLP